MYTGNTRDIFSLAIIFTVYPCVYREHQKKPVRNFKLSGLSLCIQGTLYYYQDKRGFLRFIPVYTGNTITTKQTLQSLTVYPCVYREHVLFFQSLASTDGLSLCIQGTQRCPIPAILFLRFIPVYTGNTNLIMGLSRQTPVYPCVYREHTVSYDDVFLYDGLSLCIQGTHYMTHATLAP